MIINIGEVWKDAAIAHGKYVNAEIDRVAARLRNESGWSKWCRMATAFARRHRAVLSGDSTADFGPLILQYERSFPVGPAREEADKAFMRIFNYDRFSEKQGYGKRWSAFDLCAKARFSICPYCHINSAATKLPNAAAKIKGYRPQLDHFLPKSIYPFLAISLGNLIPVCADCNGPSMKHEDWNPVSPILNPLGDEQAIRFVLAQIGGTDPLKWNLQAADDNYRIELLAESDVHRAERSLILFQLNSRYNEKARVADILDRMRSLNRSADQTQQLLPFVSAQDYRQKPADYYKKRFMGKLYLDLHEQLCLPPT